MHHNDIDTDLSADLTTTIQALSEAWDAIDALVTVHGDNPAALGVLAVGLTDITHDAALTFSRAAECADTLAYRGGPDGSLRHDYAGPGHPDAVAYAARQAAEHLRCVSRHTSAQSWALDATATALAPLRPTEAAQ